MPESRAMSASDTRALIAAAVEGLVREVPALASLKLVARLELRARGGDAPIWRVEVPGPKVTKDPAGDARIDLSIGRPEFNELAKEGRLRSWIDAYERGQVRVSGDQGVLKLLGNVIERQRARSGV
jgi:hypothetical protein